MLTFYGCGSVKIDGVVLKGADWTISPGSTRAASCICVEPAPAPTPGIATTSVRIRHCDLTVGHFQVGILIIDADRAQVEDNVIAVNPTASKFTFGKLLENRQIRANIRQLLVSNPSLQPTPIVAAKIAPKVAAKDGPAAVAVPPPAASRINPARHQVSFGAGKSTLFFDTPRALENVLPALLAAEPVKPGSVEPLPDRLNWIADKVLLDQSYRRANRPLVTWFKGLAAEYQASPTPASQGIVVAGKIATEVRIRDNTVVGTAQGIHVGLSHKGAPRSHPAGTDAAVSVSITGNSVHAYASMLLRAHEGIFVGNCGNLVIEANRLFVTPSQRLKRFFVEIDGIRVFGHIPSPVFIRHNRITGFDHQPITIHPLEPRLTPQLPLPPQLASENLID